METIQNCREKAATLRADAAKATLKNVREAKLLAASRWESIASEIEVVVGPNGESNIAEWIY